MRVEGRERELRWKVSVDGKVWERKGGGVRGRRRGGVERKGMVEKMGVGMKRDYEEMMEGEKLVRGEKVKKGFVGVEEG